MTTSLSGEEWAVLHAAQDLDRNGVYPTGDAVAIILEDINETKVRRVWTEIRKAGFVATTPKPDGLVDPEVVNYSPQEDDPWWAIPKSAQADCRRKDAKYNTAIYRLVKGKGGVIGPLAEITGLTAEAIKSRVARVEDDGEAEEDGLNADEIRYLSRRYGESDDPAVREFLADVFRNEKRHP